MVVYIVVSASGGIWGVYASRETAEYHCAMANGDLPNEKFGVVRRSVIAQ